MNKIVKKYNGKDIKAKIFLCNHDVSFSVLIDTLYSSVQYGLIDFVHSFNNFIIEKYRDKDD